MYELYWFFNLGIFLFYRFYCFEKHQATIELPLGSLFGILFLVVGTDEQIQSDIVFLQHGYFCFTGWVIVRERLAAESGNLVLLKLVIGE
ncbi:hypothetical protein XENTR_v10016769 [Xenopus tropicalis]|nr:hypothetical protein XENTR_v10016769 [Xenopus tropicalis]